MSSSKECGFKELWECIFIFLPRFKLGKPFCLSWAAALFYCFGYWATGSKWPVFCPSSYLYNVSSVTFQSFSSASLYQIPKPVSSPQRGPTSSEESSNWDGCCHPVSCAQFPSHSWKIDLPGPCSLWSLRKEMLPGRTKAVTHTAPVRTTVLAQPLRDPGLRRVLLLCESNSRAASLRGATGVCVSTPGSQRSQKAFLEERTQDSKYVYQAQENLKLLSPQSGGKLFYKGEPERI